MVLARVTQGNHQLQGAGNQEVAHQHAGGVAPHRIDGGAPAAQVGFVHHVVMEQGGGMQKLNNGGHVHVAIALIAGGPGAKNGDQRA
jgi:hypothetical protein